MANSSIASNTKFGAALGLSNGAVEPVHAMGDVNGNLIRTSDAGVNDGTSFLGGAVTLASLPSAAYTTASSPVIFSTAGITFLAVDLTITSFQGGTTPTIVMFLDRLGADTNWYNVWPGNTTGQAQGAAGLPVAFSVDVSPNGGTNWSPPNGTQHGIMTNQARFRWTTTGTPTSVTFSLSIIGR